MQSILYHNSSGDLAFTGRLKSKEVHRAISMHPVKSPPHMYRLHNYMRVSTPGLPPRGFGAQLARARNGECRERDTGRLSRLAHAGN